MAEYSLWIVSPPGLIWSHVFDETALGLQSAFRELGLDVPIVRDAGQIRGTGIVLGGNLIPMYNMALPANDLIFFNLEQMHPDSRWCAKGYGYTKLLHQYPVWDHSRRNIEALKSFGVEQAICCPIGYAPELSHITPALQHDIDALLVGGPHPRRRHMLDQLAAQGKRVHQVIKVFGEERDHWISRARLHLNIHQEPGCILEMTRVSYLLANRCLIITERGNDAELESRFEEAVVFCSYEEMAERCLHYLAHPGECKKIAERGFEIFRAMKQRDFLEQALEEHKHVYGTGAPKIAAERKWCIWIVSPPGYPKTRCFEEAALALQAAFRALGQDVPVVTDFSRIVGTPIVFGGNVLATQPRLGTLPAESIIFNMEQVVADSWWFMPERGYIELLRRHRVWDYSRQNIEKLKELGISHVAHCALGYMPELSRIAAADTEDYDVTFFGAPHKRRLEIMEQLRARGLNARLFENHYGEKRDAIIARSKVMINMHMYNAHVFEIARVSYLLANRKCVISETGNDTRLEAPFSKAVVFRPYEKLVDACVEYVADEKKRRRQAESGFRIFSRMSQIPLLEKALQETQLLSVEPPAALPKIFVAIPSYRDTECQWTVKDLFEKAAHPERISVGVCWQFDAVEDKACFEIPCPRPAQLRVRNFHYKDAVGIGWARAQAFDLWQGEDYALLIDSHMRFEPGWDDALIDMLGRCPTPKAVISACVPGYKPPRELQATPGQMVRTRIHALGEKDSPQMLHQARAYVPLSDIERCGLYPAPFTVGNFLFCRAEVIRALPIDPHIQFWGEEITYSARLWTHGYDIFQPDRLVAYHYWRRDELLSQQHYRRLDTPRSRQVHARIRHMLGLEQSSDPQALAEIGRYGQMGTERPLESLWRFAGVDWEKRTVSKDAKEGRWDMQAYAQRNQSARPRIFVAIPSYRDAECRWTVKDLFEKAAHPERIFVGICWQADARDKECFAKAPHADQLREIRVKTKDSKGAGWARAQALSLAQGEEYTLLIDAHMRFAQGWDERLLAALAQCPGGQVALSGMLPRYWPGKLQDCSEKRSFIGVSGLGEAGDMQPVHLGWMDVPRAQCGDTPALSAFTVANFIFAPSRLFAEVPVDPHIYFYGDEITYSARLWTHGWDVYQPDSGILYHYWDRPGGKYKEPGKEARLALQRVRHLLGVEKAKDDAALAELERYGMGAARSLRDFWAFSGIDLKKRVAAPYAVQGQWQPYVPPRPRIFVSIASYRDPECQWTVKDLFEKAAHPERIFAGICWQFDAERDQRCFQVETRPEQVRVLPFDWRDSEGVTWARHQIKSLWDGEEYSLQIDSHMRFVPGWDEAMIAELAACDSPKPVLSCYPARYTPPDRLDENAKTTVLCVHPFKPEGSVRIKSLDVDVTPERPLPGLLVSCAFIFARSEIIEDIPYDPYLYFEPEEAAYALRLYTHGWNVFSPRRALTYHYFNDGPVPVDRPLHWPDFEQGGMVDKVRALARRAQKRFDHITGFAPSSDPEVTKELDCYGLGKARTLAQFEQATGIDFKRKIAGPKALDYVFRDALEQQRRPCIFVNIASYRDPECQWTVKDLFEKAAHPERIFVGICWQFDPDEDQHCFQVATRPGQVRVFPVDWREAEGVCWARHMTQQLWEGEEYTLMLDSHMRFVPGWDELMIAELAACDSPKPVLSNSPAPYVPPDHLSPNMQPTIRRVKPFTPDGNIRGQGEQLERVPEKPLRGAFIVANFVFSRAEIIREVPYDPYLYFDQEEVSYAARLYTHGWDVFSTRQQFLYHFYNDKKIPGAPTRPLHWNDVFKEDAPRIHFLRDRGLKRFNHLTGHRLSDDPEVLRDIEHFGLGTVRTLAQFEAFTGIDFKRKIASDKAIRALFIENLRQYRDHPIYVPEVDGPRQAFLNSAPPPPIQPPAMLGYGMQKVTPAPLRQPFMQPMVPAVSMPAKMLETGDFMPLIELTDGSGKRIALEVYAGMHVMLYVLPAAQPSYVEEFLQQAQQQSAQHGHKLWRICVLDAAPDMVKTWQQRAGSVATLWADPERRVAQALGLYHAGDAAVMPAGFVLDPNLKIASRHAGLGAPELAAAVTRDAYAAMQAYRLKQQPQVISEIAPALIVPNVFSPELCRKCIDAFHAGHTFEGTVGAEETKGYRPNAKVRTDFIVNGALLEEIDDKLSRSLFPEIKKVFGFTVAHREIYKVGAYKGEKKGFFKQHRDNFEAPLAYRRVAMTLQLNDDYEGGGLRFPEYGDTIYRPAKGSAIAFSCGTMHEARAVTAGERFILVGFFHSDEDEAWRRYFAASIGRPPHDHDFKPKLHSYPGLKESRYFFTEWREQNAHFGPAAPVLPPAQEIAPRIAIRTLGHHQAAKVSESAQAIVLDDFLPEELYQQLRRFTEQAQYERANAEERIQRIGQISEGNPLRGVTAYGYPSNANPPEIEAFIGHMLAAGPHIERVCGRQHADWYRLSAAAWMHPAGSGMSLHSADASACTGGYFYFLNPLWKSHWGGQLLMPDDEGSRLIAQANGHAVPEELLMERGFARCILPKKNRAVFIAKGVHHMITRVNEQAGDNPHLSLAGFFHRKT